MVTRYSVEQNNEYKPGTWKGLKTQSGRSASITCPKCSLLCVLTDHEIKADGLVNPSVVCPSPDCDFHEFVVLNGWAGD